MSTVPTLSVTFDGLFFFCFNDSGVCQVGVHTKAENHHIKIELIDKTNGKIISTFTLDHFVTRGLERIRLRSNTVGVSTEPGDIGDRSDRTKNPKSFDWVLDFQSTDLHAATDLMIERGHFKPILEFETGAFSTLNVSGCDYICTQHKKPRYFGHVAEAVLVDILADPSTLHIEIEVAGTTTTLPFPPGKFALKIRNVDKDLKDDTGAKSFRDDAGEIRVPPSDIGKYYSAFKGITNPDRFTFDPIAHSDDTTLSIGLPPSICYGTRGSKTKTIS
jgi:hypothetical protein